VKKLIDCFVLALIIAILSCTIYASLN